GGDGKEVIWRLPDGDYIPRLTGRFGTWIDSLTIYTRSGSSYNYGGSGGDRAFDPQASGDEEVTGFFGRAGGNLDQIGILTRKRRSEERRVGKEGKLRGAWDDKTMDEGATVVGVGMRISDSINASQLLSKSANITQVDLG